MPRQHVMAPMTETGPPQAAEAAVTARASPRLEPTWQAPGRHVMGPAHSTKPSFRAEHGSPSPDPQKGRKSRTQAPAPGLPACPLPGILVPKIIYGGSDQLTALLAESGQSYGEVAVLGFGPVARRVPSLLSRPNQN
jgi:hypothetical protein